MKKIKDFLLQLTLHERSPEKLALSFCIGNYIAFSPFPGLHTVMIFAFAWLFQLNFSVTFAAAYTINNPFTALPLYLGDYFFGYWLVHDYLHVDVQRFTPSFVKSIESFLQTLGIVNPCFWSFIVGGNVLGIALSLLLYPCMKYTFKKLVPLSTLVNPSGSIS
jgi:uncharacterized protein (DUF2062 family)